MNGNTVIKKHRPGVNDKDDLAVPEQKYQNLIENINEVVFSVGSNGLVTYISPSVRQFTCFSESEIVSRPFLSFVHPDDVAVIETNMRESRAGRVKPCKFRIRDKHGGFRHVRASFKKEGIKGGLNGIMVDDTEWRLTVNIIDSLPDATFVVNSDGIVIAWNHAIEEMTGVKKEDIIGKGDYAYSIPFYGRPRPMLVDLVSKPDRVIENSYEVFVKEGDELRSEGYVPGVYKDKGAYLWSKVSPLYNEDRIIIGAIQTIRDITEKKNLEEHLKTLGLYDSLTGLCNRTYFEEESRRAECGRYKSVGLILCDVDGLKLVNDTMGHDAGDAILVAVADIVKKSFRKSDIVARIGGDEFAVLIPDATQEILEDMICRIQNTIDKYNAVDQEIPLSISTGFAYSNDSGICMKELFKKADNSMYWKKSLKRTSTRNFIVRNFVKTLETKDFIAEGHVDRLKIIVTDIAAAISLPKNRIDDLQLLAQFHDIGKVGIPNHILFKPGPLTTEEYTKIHRHCEIGHYIAVSSSNLTAIADWI